MPVKLMDDPSAVALLYHMAQRRHHGVGIITVRPQHKRLIKLGILSSEDAKWPSSFTYKLMLTPRGHRILSTKRWSDYFDVKFTMDKL